MPHKEDRSGWVAVPPEHQGSGGGGQEQQLPVKKASSAFQYFQRDVAAQLRPLKLDFVAYNRAVRERWEALDESERLVYERRAAADRDRYRRESHQRDVEALERQERLRRERERLVLLDEGHEDKEYNGGDDEDDEDPAGAGRRRLTRKALRKKSGSYDDDDDDESSYESDDSSGDDEEDDDDGDDDAESKPKKDKKKKKKMKSSSKGSAAKRKPRELSEKQRELSERRRAEKAEKDQYIAGRQQDLQKEKAAQAKRRLEFLLKQSAIFSHFGRVKEDTAKYGIKTAAASAATTTTAPAGGVRRSASALKDDDDDDNDNMELEEADEHEATFLMAQPSTLSHGKMRDYQLEGLNWMIRLQENGVNGILADEMGLGKTLQSISILVYLLEYRECNGPHLIVVPKSTLSNWMNEFGRWAPTIKVVKFHGDKAAREEIVKNVLEPAQRDEDRTWHVCITTYEICNIERSVLQKFCWTYFILDEAHRLKNETSALSKTVRSFETSNRILITGTPLQNSLHELWALLNFLVPDVFESSEQFDEWFNLDIEDGDEKQKLILQLHKILRPFMLRRLKADVEKSLPPKHETILFTGLSAMQKKLYRDILMRDIEAIQGTSGSRTAILNIVMQLRKCAGHPYLFPGVEDRTLPPLGEHLVENCGKMVLLDKLLRRLKERGHRVLVFTQFARILDILEDYMVMRRFLYCRIDGNTSYDDRERMIDEYNAPDSEKFVFLLSTRAGGLGINLQTADVVIIYDSDWNPQMDLQAQDRAHRIGQKKPVQVFRLVTEHTIEEKIVERAQQKLKLDAMVVQSGRLKDKDSKLSRDELLAAVRFGADKIFKSKDSSITDDDIDMILDIGKRKTQELNEKLQAADKGDLLDFKFDGSSVKTFEGVDYSSVLAQAKAEAEMLGILDMGKRERKEANYNENSLFQKQIASISGPQKPKKKKAVRLPKELRLPRMEEWQMYDRDTLLKIQEEEEAAFRELPDEVQKQATLMQKSEEHDSSDAIHGEEADAEARIPVGPNSDAQTESFVLPPLISDERKDLKARLLKEGFSDWKRFDFNAFLKASAKYGRHDCEKIAYEVNKPEADVRRFADAFWGEPGKTRIAEHEYDRAVKMIERGEKRLEEIKSLARGTRILLSLFDNPWQELEFTYVNCKDKMFTAEEDRCLLCWTRKYGYGQWQAIRIAIRRNPVFRFNYFLRSLPIEHLARRCEQLMKAAEKEVEHLERKAREDAGLPVEPSAEGETLPPIKLPKFRVIQARYHKEEREKAHKERHLLQQNVSDLERQIKEVKDQLRALNEGSIIARVSPTEDPEPPAPKPKEKKRPRGVDKGGDYEDQQTRDVEDPNGAIGPEGDFLPFPEYDGSEEPVEWKKPFTHFCIHTRKEVKQSLDSTARKDKKQVNGILKERWEKLSEDDKEVWRQWSEWDKKRYAHELEIHEEAKHKNDAVDVSHVPKKRKSTSGDDTLSIPKKRKS